MVTATITIDPARQRRRTERLLVQKKVIGYLQRCAQVVWFEISSFDPRLLVGQLNTGKAFAVLVKLPQEVVSDAMQRFLTRVASNKGCSFVVGEVEEVEVWLRKLGL